MIKIAFLLLLFIPLFAFNLLLQARFYLTQSYKGDLMVGPTQSRILKDLCDTQR